jgi:hypothetical protein
VSIESYLAKNCVESHDLLGSVGMEVVVERRDRQADRVRRVRRILLVHRCDRRGERGDRSVDLHHLRSWQARRSRLGLVPDRDQDRLDLLRAHPVWRALGKLTERDVDETLSGPLDVAEIRRHGAVHDIPSATDECERGDYELHGSRPFRQKGAAYVPSSTPDPKVT